MMKRSATAGGCYEVWMMNGAPPATSFPVENSQAKSVADSLQPRKCAGKNHRRLLWSMNDRTERRLLRVF